MLRTALNLACEAKSAHTAFIKNRTLRPVVVSAKRFDGILARSRMDKKNQQIADVEEEQRYKEYLKEGSDNLCSYFTNMTNNSLDDEKEAKLEQELKEAEIIEKQIKKEDEQLRKERIMRAVRMLDALKPGDRALHHALIESDTIFQRKNIRTENRKIRKEARRQKRLDDRQCPEMLIPFCGVTEEQEKAEREERAVAHGADLQKAIEERRKQRDKERERYVGECAFERMQFTWHKQNEEKAAQALVEKNREFYRSAYREALKEKAEKAKYARICDEVEDRIVCVARGKQRFLDTCRDKRVKDIKQDLERKREVFAATLCRKEQERKEQELQDEILVRYEAAKVEDELRRKYELERLSQERRAYQLDERGDAEEQRRRNAQIRRFEVATRYANDRANKHFFDTKRQQKMKESLKLRNTLEEQREEFLARQREQLVGRTACIEDPYLKEDVKFFNKALKVMSQARKQRRPLYPIAKAVEAYRRENQIDVVTEGRMVRRSKLRDYCWPGYHSKADLAYMKYEQRDKCREQMASDHNDILSSCIKITDMASKERPFKPCVPKRGIKCLRNRYMSVPNLDAQKHKKTNNSPAEMCHQTGSNISANAFINSKVSNYPISSNPVSSDLNFSSSLRPIEGMMRLSEGF